MAATDFDIRLGACLALSRSPRLGIHLQLGRPGPGPRPICISSVMFRVSTPWVWVTGNRGSGRSGPGSPTLRGVALTSRTGPRAFRAHTPEIPRARSSSRAPRDRFGPRRFVSFRLLGTGPTSTPGGHGADLGGWDQKPQPGPGGPWWGFQSEGYRTPRTEASSSDWGPGMVSTEERSTARSPVDPVH